MQNSVNKREVRSNIKSSIYHILDTIATLFMPNTYSENSFDGCKACRASSLAKIYKLTKLLKNFDANVFCLIAFHAIIDFVL